LDEISTRKLEVYACLHLDERCIITKLRWQLGEVLECLKKESPSIVIQQYFFLQQLILHLQPWNKLHVTRDNQTVQLQQYN
ncbi:Uncharacterized protein APZ42_000763, partial [Daphnia magna]